jgi:hypothetical protein
MVWTGSLRVPTLYDPRNVGFNPKRRDLALARFDFFLAWREIGEDLCDLMGHFARLGERLKLLVNVCHVSLFARPDSTDYDKMLLFVNPVDHSVCREFVLPVQLKWRTQRKSITLRIDCQLFRQHFLELIFYAPVQSLHVLEGIASERD